MPSASASTRTELGSRENPGAMYKPWLAVLPQTGEVLALAFCGMGWGPAQCRSDGNGTAGDQPEHGVLWRSTDHGRSWSADDDQPKLLGREFSLVALRDGTLLAPFVTADDTLKGAFPNGLYRSTDKGRSWASLGGSAIHASGV